jgi:hypothetical protein
MSAIADDTEVLTSRPDVRGGRLRRARRLSDRAAVVCAAAAALTFTLPSTASATFPGRNGVLLVAGESSGGIGASAAPRARTAECGYPWAWWTLRPDGKNSGHAGPGNRALFSPRGLRLAVDYWGDPCWSYGNEGPDPSAGLSIARPDGSHARAVTGDGLIGFLPDGRLVVWQQEPSGTLRLLDGLNGVVIMTLPDKNTDLSSDTDEFAMSCSARVALARHTRAGYELDVLTRTLVNVGGARRVRTVIRTVANNRYWLGGPAWAPDGRTLVFNHKDRPGEHGQVSLWTVAANGGRLHRLSHPSGKQDFGTKWSPDGRRMTFLRWHTKGENSVPEEIVMNADGSGAKVLVRYPDDIGGVGNLVWSPDGKSMAINPYHGELWMVDSTTGARKTVSFDGDALLDWQAVGGHPVRCAYRGSAPIDNTPTGLG